MKRRYIFLLLLSFVLISCKNQSIKPRKIVDPSSIIYDTAKVKSIKNISLKKTVDYLIVNGKKKYLSIYSIVKPRNNKIYFYDNLNVYVTDLDFKVLKYINLKDDDFHFNGRVSDLAIIKGDIYLLSHANTIVKISNYSSNNIEDIRLDLKSSKSYYKGEITGISNFDDKYILTTEGILPLENYSNSDSVELARLFDLHGKFIMSYKIAKSEADNYWKKDVATDFAACKDSLIYFTFVVSRNVYVFNVNGHLSNIYQFQVDDKYWHAPKSEENTIITKGNFKGHGRTTFYVPITTNSIPIQGNTVFALISRGMKKIPDLTAYNRNFKLKEKENLEGIPPGFGYRIYTAGKEIILHGREFYYVFQ